jgi:hypothetical protein
MGNINDTTTQGLAIAGIVVCVVAVLLGVALLVWLLRYNYRRHHHHHRPNEVASEPGFGQPSLQAAVYIPGGGSGSSNSARF